MKGFLLFIVMIPVLLLGSCLGGELLMARHYVYRQKLTIEMMTPAGIRAGSSVTHVHWTDRRRVPMNIGNDWLGSGRGEAVFVDLGDGKHAIALIPGDDFHSRVRGLLPMANEDSARAALSDIGKVLDVPASEVPTIVTFTDINDPASAKIVFGTQYRQQCREDRKPACVPENIPVPIDEIAAAFGPGYAFRRATLEMMPAGWWPFNRWDGGWPQWLFGEPLTRGIEQRLPWINDPELGRNPRWAKLPDIAQTTITSLKRSGY
ncbi:MAG: hypothetical protein IOC94_15695 [Methylocystis sp.]|nr:hypothetical protein [Methylocystis sp.]